MQKYVYVQSGAAGVFGRVKLLEYWYQLLYVFIPGYSFKKAIHVTKTVTLEPRIYPRKGNTELRSGYKIRRLFPKSIWVSWRSFCRGYMLNAVGINNEGLENMLQRGILQQRKDSFQISIQLEQSNEEELKKEILHICRLLLRQKWNGVYTLQINESCPNTEHGINQANLDLLRYKLDLFKLYLPGIDIWLKFNALIHEDVLMYLNSRKLCKGFVVSNTIPFGQAKKFINWDRLFPNGSPINKRLGNDQNGNPIMGGLSGKPVYPVLIDCLKRISIKDPTVNIIAGGGVFKKAQINELVKFRPVKAVTLGCVALLRPWRLNRLVEFGNKIFNHKN